MFGCFTSQFGFLIDRSRDDLTFAYGEVVSRSVDNSVDGILRMCWLREDLYRERHSGQRSGAALLLREGAGDQNPNILIPSDAIPIDGMSHKEMADVFNKCERLYSFDPYTLLTYYAARCGCVPITVPPADMRKDDWHQKEEFRFGHALMRRVRKEKKDEERSLKEFLDIVELKYTKLMGSSV